MRTALLIILVLFFSNVGLAQVRISAHPTGKHQTLIQHAKTGKKFYDHLKQQKKDSIDIIKADTSLARKEKRERIKALKGRFKEERREAKRYAKNRVEDETGYTVPDSITYPPKTPDDSLKWALQVLASQGDYQEIQRIHQAYATVDSISIDSVGYTAAKQSEQIAESFLPEELKTAPDAPELDQSVLPMSQIPETELPHKRLDELLESAPEASIDDAVNSMKDLKSKYAELPDMRYPEKGVKKNSLKGKGLKKRLTPGGNVAIQSTDPFILDADFQLGFRINKKWTIGGSLIWREAFGKVDSLSRVSAESGHGYGGFTSYDLFANFFFYSEYLGMKNQALFSPEQDDQARWEYEWLVGIGNQIQLFKYLNLTMILAYDLNHKNNELHSRPVVLKVGYRVSELPFIGKK